MNLNSRQAFTTHKIETKHLTSADIERLKGFNKL